MLVARPVRSLFSLELSHRNASFIKSKNNFVFFFFSILILGCVQIGTLFTRNLLYFLLPVDGAKSLSMFTHLGNSWELDFERQNYCLLLKEGS